MGTYHHSERKQSKNCNVRNIFSLALLRKHFFNLTSISSLLFLLTLDVSVKPIIFRDAEASTTYKVQQKGSNQCSERPL